METNVLRQVEVDEVIFFAENQYNRTDKAEYQRVFDEMVAEGHLVGCYHDTKWTGFSGIKSFGVDFSMDEVAYTRHFGREFGISFATMQDMLRCYALCILGAYIFPTIRQKISSIKKFLTSFGQKGMVMSRDAAEAIQDFLLYIGTPESMVMDITQRIHFTKAEASKPRELSHLINYLAIANEINDLYQSGLSDEEFKKWFPIFFWTNITFVIPLRATEMLVTPLECIRHEEYQTSITLRRTMLKGKKCIVQYEVERDYKEFSYKVPNTWVIETIERYQELTSSHPRKYLFDHTRYMINNMISLQSFNMLLADFITTYLIGNPKYDYARYATGIKEFEIVSAGDSRPIAMANLYFQDISADICRQLADHSQISTSFGYYTNVSNTIQCASVMKIQRKINRERYEVASVEISSSDKFVRNKYGGTESQCLSPLQPQITGNISDCVKENHIHECMGCRYYSPTESELKNALDERKKKLDSISKQLVEHIAETRVGKGERTDVDKLLLETHTNAIRFKRISDEYAEEAEYKWQRHRNTQTKNC